MSNVESRVRRILVSHFGICASDLESCMDLIINLGADSLDIIEVSIMLEEEFGIGVSDSEIYILKTIEGISQKIALAVQNERAQLVSVP